MSPFWWITSWNLSCTGIKPKWEIKWYGLICDKCVIMSEDLRDVPL